MTRRQVGCTGLLLVILGVAYLAWTAGPGSVNIAPNVSSQVIRDVTEYVESHDGQWPRNWDDFPNGPHARRLVRVDFDVSVEELIQEPERMRTAIVPVTGKNYPHAERRLEGLRAILSRHHEQQTAN